MHFSDISAAWVGLGFLYFFFFTSTFAQRKAEIWGAQVGALSKVPTDRSAQRRRTHLLTVRT